MKNEEKMNENNVKWICGSIIASIFIIGLFGIFWAMCLTDVKFTTEIKLDDNTKDYLIEHDYCIFMENSPYNSNESTFLFFGDCKYLNYTLWK